MRNSNKNNVQKAKNQSLINQTPGGGDVIEPSDIMINMILDRSASMELVRDETIRSFNNFIEDQKKIPGRVLVSLILFNTVFNSVYVAKPIQEVSPLTWDSYIPDGFTALFDAIGKTVSEVRTALEGQNRPDKVLFVVITDGEENSSREYSKPKIFDLIAQARNNDNFEFVFLGANQDAWARGHDIGFANTYGFTSAPQSTQRTMDYFSKCVTSYRSNVDQNTDDFFQGKIQDEKEKEDDGD